MHRSMRRLSAAAFAIPALVYLAAAPVRADDAPAPPVQAADAPDVATGDQIREVVVTANKRLENVKDIPASISVVGGQDLADHHVADYDDLTRAVPGISFGAGASGAGAGEGEANVEIRGVSSNTGSATVGVYVDEVPVTVRNTYDGSTQPIMFDIDRVEVLRGPQGTLYGASSMGGTIRFLTKQPDLDTMTETFQSDLSGTVRGGINYDEQGIINVPVVPGVFAVRAGVDYGSDSGWIDHYGLSGNLLDSGVNSQWHLVGKLAAKYQGDDFSVLPQMLFQRVKSDDSPVFYPALGLYKQDIENAQPSLDSFFVPSLTVNKDVGFADLTSVTSYFWRQMNRINDGTYYNADILATAFLDPVKPAYQPQTDAVIGQAPAPVFFDTNYEQTTQEFRLASKSKIESGLPYQWVAGLFYSNQWYMHHDIEPIPGLNADFEKLYGENSAQVQADLGYGTPGPGNPNLFANDLIYYEDGHLDERQYAGFGQFDFDVTPKLHGAAGIRYVYARVSDTRDGGGFYDYGNVHPFTDNSRFYAATPKFSVTYDLTPETNLYASAAKGFRLGGPTGPTPVGPGNPCAQDYQNLGITTVPTKYDSDKLWTYEAGTHALLADKTLSVNADAYYIEWQDLQQTIDLPICGFNFTSNVGNAESYGTELELRYKPPVKGLTLTYSGSLNKATITSTTNSATAAVGEKVLNTPDWTSTIGASYDWQLTGSTSAFVRADYDWTGRSHGSFVRTNSDYSDPQYGIMNASVGIDTGTYRVSLYAKNLTNDQTIIQRPQVNTVITGYTVRPLTIGLTVGAYF